ncbi:MAG: carbohydrate binding family 9 domain-containing protein, partial [Ignavibacteria bacterium]|nr:carbohydrate binding family 9 domain-containing protein [Ignavibacteria bacterium]
MHKTLFAIIILCLTNPLFSSSSEIINKNSKIKAYRSNDEIKLDGLLNEHIWKNDSIENLYQRNPDEGKPATEKSMIWVAYDEDAVYVAAKLFDTSPDSIVSQMARRDNISEADLFAVAFDSYNDNRTAFFFGVEPSGSFLDGRFFNDDSDDDSWNGVWDFATKIDSDGWNVEMKIPFSQLRFNQSDEMIWGVNFYRKIQRRNEEDFFVMVPKNESGFVSHFADLVGLNGIKPKPRFELLPYVVSKAQYLVHDSNDPFYKSKQYKFAGGLDSKIGLGSNLTIDATFNPDFGQVEVDPAVINLSAFETYYDEKRPFFIEGNEIFYFGSGGANNNWSFNWMNPELFYSRRIGRPPQGSIENDGFVNYPTETRILGAAKLTGKIGENWSIGFINAFTERTFAEIDSNGVRLEKEVEPFTYYGIFRTKTEFNSEMHSVGFISTIAIRDLQEPSLKNTLSDKSFVIGSDGWTFLDDDKTYVLTGYFAGSYSHGSKDYLIKLQKEPQRYFQRPDATYATLDSNLTSLTGWIGRIMLNKQKGNFYFNSAVGAVSPGFNINDLGFQFRADAINGHLVTGYRWFEPDDIFRRKQIYIAYFRSYDFEGNLSNAGYFLFANAQFLNYYG